MAASTQFDFHSFKTQVNGSVVAAKYERSHIDAFQSLVKGGAGSDTEKLQCVDLSLRDLLTDIIRRDGSIQAALPLLDFTLLAISKEACPIGTIFSLLMDLSDCSTISQSEELFGYVEAQMHQWKVEPLFTKGKNHLLRMCNDILKKLSKSQDTVFCGRIQLFLARLFPLTEKSGLNLLSEFNLDNLTIFSDATPSDFSVEKQAEQMETDELGLSLAQDTPVDYAFYTKFWSLQDFFRDPLKCFSKAQWKKFSTYADSVLVTFQSLKLDDSKSQRNRQKLAAVKNVKDQHKFFAKYLTSEKLFNLQLSDGNFRRYVLVQFLILFQYLTSPVKFRSTQHTCNDDMKTWIKKCSDLVLELISQTPPDGELFLLTVKKVLIMEHTWNDWKNTQCPSYVKKGDTSQSRTRIIVRKRSMIDDLNITDPKMINLGNTELNNLWNQHADNDEIIKSEKRQFVPALDQYFEDAMMAADPVNQIEETYKDVHKAGWQWRALRLLSKKSRHLFEQTQTPARKIPDYLEDIMRKLAKEVTPSADNVQAVEEEIAVQTGQNQEEDEIEEEPEETTTSADVDREITPEPSQAGEEMDTSTSQTSLLDSMVSADHINTLADLVKDKWEQLASKFSDLDPDDLVYFKEKETPLLQASNMLTVWKEMANKKATVGVMITALKEAGMGSIAEEVFKTSV